MKRIATLFSLLLAGCASHNAKIGLSTKHTVQNGEVLADIATRYYGEKNRIAGIKAIIESNPQIKDDRRMGDPLILTIPELNKNE
jgi:starvation-inducible outer membrane lipoprotein